MPSGLSALICLGEEEFGDLLPLFEGRLRQMDQPVLDSSWNEESPPGAPLEAGNLPSHQVVVPSPQLS
ncbi:hypothetical protein HOLleu_12380 [Holothuria leucospilota]|nr:hypothetical protein HOLleu_12380 [Holothuria leucospilota]